MADLKHVDLYDQPLYRIGEAALYSRLSTSTLRTWVDKGLIETPAGDTSFSYNNLVEAYILKSIRAEGVKGANLNQAVLQLRKLSKAPHPLFTVKLHTEGTRLFLKEFASLIDLSRHGQYALTPLLLKYLKRIEWKDLRPVKFYPEVENSKSKVIAIRPDVGSGRPFIDGEGVLVDVLYGRFRAGESEQDLALDYDLKLSTIKTALIYYEQIRKAA